MNKFVFLLLLLVLTQHAGACTCASLRGLTKKSAKELNGAYLGKIVSIENGEDDYTMRFGLVVSENLHGKVLDTLFFNASDDAGICGISTEVGDEWLITFDTEAGGTPFVSICSRAYNLARLTTRRKFVRFRFKYHENRYARKELQHAKNDLRVLRLVK